MSNGRCACGGIAFQGVLIKGVFTPLCGDHKKKYDEEQTLEQEVEKLRKDNEALRQDLKSERKRSQSLSARIADMERVMRDRTR